MNHCLDHNNTTIHTNDAVMFIDDNGGEHEAIVCRTFPEQNKIEIKTENFTKTVPAAQCYYLP